MGVEMLASFLDSAGAEQTVSPTNPLPVDQQGRDEQATELLASAARTADGNGSAVSGLGKYSKLFFELDVTAAATEAGDTLDVFIQTTIDGTNWIDVVHFTQCTGDGGAKRYIAKINASLAETMFENGTALAESAVRNILGDQYRVRWAIVDVPTADNQSFTFSVTANGII